MRLTAITIALGGEDRNFDLKLRGQRATEARCGVGLGQVLGRLWTGLGDSPAEYRFHVDDYRETILQALIDGGMKDGEASRLVMGSVDGHPAIDAVPIAVRILTAWLNGIPQVKTEPVETNDETAMAPAASTSPPSTEPEPPSD